MRRKLHDIRESKVWKEAVEVGEAKKLKKIVHDMLRRQKSVEEIADLLNHPLEAIRSVAEELVK